MFAMLFILIAGDLLIGLISLHAGLYLRLGTVHQPFVTVIQNSVRILLYSGTLLVVSHFVGLYSFENGKGRKEVLVRVLLNLVLSFFVLSSLFYMAPQFSIGRGALAISFAVFGLLQFFWHIGHVTCISLPMFAKRIMIVGAGPLANKIGAVVSSLHSPYVLSGYLQCSSEKGSVPAHCIMGKSDDLISMALRERVHKIVVSLSERRGSYPLKELISCKFQGIEVIDAPSFYERVTGKLLVENITPSWLIFSDGFRVTQMKKKAKRCTDLLLAAVGLLIASPLFPLIALAIRLTSAGPIFFRQERVGEGERPFTLFKFRTMRADAEKSTGAVWAQKDDPRITAVGSFLRKTRLDELPQMLNVLKGDMSFVGPRPERPEFVAMLKEQIPYYSERHFVKPGITGWAQVRYSYGASVEDSFEKLRYDLFYIKHLSLFNDLMILLETVKVVLLGRGGR